MNRIRYFLRNSLAAKVILSTVFLSLGVVWLTGSALYTQLSSGVKAVNLETSLAEARSSFFNAQYQFLLVQDKSTSQINKVTQQIIKSSTEVGVNQARKDIVLLKIDDSAVNDARYQGNIYNFASDGVSLKSVPSTLRKAVMKKEDLVYQYASFSRLSGIETESLIIGRKIEIPKSGTYEMYLIYSLANQRTTLDLISNALLLTGLALLLLISLITWLVVRQVVSPVRDAARIAEQFTKGDFSRRMEIKSTDEIAKLGTSFNEMALSLESQISRLENLSRVQQRFVSDVSHELRTPLTTLRMASEVIYSHRSGFDPTLSRSAELLIAQLDRFERLLEDLLEVSRFDAEVAVLESVEFDVIPLIARCIADVGSTGADHPISIDMDPELEHVVIKADIRRVERIMRNLLSNALDHAEGKPVKVEIVETSTEVAIGVRDYGEGLDATSLHRVFDRFWRADPSRSRVRGGTGLGLSIALEDARLHNGELDAWGRPGLGAHFVLTLPRIAGEQITGRPLKLEPNDAHKFGG
jgi:two-component system sensor histidine kinase MtrB